MLRGLVSGGQTGADRAALDVALEWPIFATGWVPKGRAAEDGTISPKYPNLRETENSDPALRTENNVRDSDGTLILSHGTLVGGSSLTYEIASRLQKPLLHVDL